IVAIMDPPGGNRLLLVVLLLPPVNASSRKSEGGTSAIHHEASVTIVICRRSWILALECGLVSKGGRGRRGTGHRTWTSGIRPSRRSMGAKKRAWEACYEIRTATGNPQKKDGA